ncbi:MAG: hypothetical protein WD021_09675 [Rhodothermales bacterium]
METYEQLLDQGERLVRSGDQVAGVRKYARAAELDPKRKEAFTKLGLVYREYGDVDSAMNFFAQAASLDEKDAFVRFNLGLIQYGEGMLDRARETLEEAVSIVQTGIAGARVEAEGLRSDKQGILLHQCDELEQTVVDAQALLAQIATDQAATPESGFASGQAG